MKKLILYSFVLFSLLINAQEKDNFLPKGNESYTEKDYVNAEANYRISESKSSKKAITSYNLGNSIYRQNQASEAKYHFAKAIENAKTREEKHKAYHNIGNSFMKEKDYSNAVEAYKNALRNNPTDEETRYNFALAKQLAKDNPSKKDGDKKKENQKDKEKKEENKDKKDENKENKDGQNKKDQNENKENKDGKPQPGDMSKEHLENLLDAVNNEEKKIQDKVKKHKALANPKQTDKDW